MFLNIGFGNYVSKNRIISILTPESSPIKRLIRNSKINNSLVDSTCGRKVKSVILLDTSHVVLSSMDAISIINSLKGGGNL